MYRHRTPRQRSLERLSEERFDLLVVGAGICGARVAFEAARAGLRVALVDAGDFGGATSSRSGKLVHGGLRYLRNGDLRLVRRARAEQRILAARVAPHLVRRLPMLLASTERGASRFATLLGGPLAYWALDRFRSRGLRISAPGRASALFPPGCTEEFGPSVLLGEAVTDDGRLTLATVKAAVRAGAVAANHLEVIELQRSQYEISGAVLRGREGEGPLTVRCRAVVNAAGPWLDRLRLLEDPKRRPAVRLSKGVHLALALEDPWHAALALSLDATRHIYAVPWHGVLLLGTTDTPYDGDPGTVATEPEEVASLLERASYFLPKDMTRRITCSFAGLRVLQPGGANTYEASREHVVCVGPAGMVSVGGGKLTTHRPTAIDALRRLPAEVRPRRLRSNSEPLPGSAPPDARALYARLDREIVEHVVRLYGGEAARLLEYDGSLPDALERIHPEGPDIWAQVYHAVNEEWAVTVEDVVRRRTILQIRGLATAAVRDRIATALLATSAPP